MFNALPCSRHFKDLCMCVGVHRYKHTWFVCCWTVWFMMTPAWLWLFVHKQYCSAKMSKQKHYDFTQCIPPPRPNSPTSIYYSPANIWMTKCKSFLAHAPSFQKVWDNHRFGSLCWHTQPVLKTCPRWRWLNCLSSDKRHKLDLIQRAVMLR